jgi:sugar lactone lactonase YvrE
MRTHIVSSDAAIEAMLARRAQRFDLGDLREVAFASIEATPRRRPWLAPPAGSPWVGRSSRAAILVVAAALLVAALGGAVIVAGHFGVAPWLPFRPAGTGPCIVSTLAGVPGEVGAVDGTGAAARFGEEAFGIAIDPSGVLYLADSGNRVIRRVTRDGAVTTFAGRPGAMGGVDGKGPEARFSKPAGIAIDAAGNLYVADNLGNTIRKITPDGTVTTLAGTYGAVGSADGTGPEARFNSPAGVAVDSAGNVYVGAFGERAIRKIAPDGTVSTLAGSLVTGTADGTGPDAQFTMPWTLAIDAQGVLWVVDEAVDLNSSRLRTVTPDGAVTTVEVDWAAAGVGWPGSPWVDRSGNVFLTTSASTVLRLAPDGTITRLAGKPGENGSSDGTGDVARFSEPIGIVGDDAGVLYVVDTWNQAIRTIRCP